MSATNRFLCIHGHFYQPPRENPWLEAIEMQDSAAPYHDWNERIDAECYGPNGAARILDDRGHIASIINNYSRISFNFGPTLLSWLQSEAPKTYRSIVEADRGSLKRYGGHGSAMAQAYGHMILPLASVRDLKTQVVWGIRDFEHRFGREPEGMWLPETAVDLATLETLAAHGIRFTILTQYQAARFRRIGDTEWSDVPPEGIDPSRAYRVDLPSGKSIALFFYHGPASRAVAFESLLNSGDLFARRLRESLPDGGGDPALAHIATDGESYGHHHRFGEMALAYAMHAVESAGEIELTNYSRFLEAAPPQYEVEIRENTSWSCAHGLGRWTDDCGCNTGAGPGWNQHWRKPLREALDSVRDRIAPLFERKAGELFRDPWEARDGYIDVILDRGPESTARFLERHALRPLSGTERQAALELMEMQRHAMLMYTSCGWFFNDISGIETVQILKYAARTLQLADRVLGIDPEPEFLAILEKAESNRPAFGNGARIYREQVLPSRVDLQRVGARCAVSALFEEPAPRVRTHVYNLERAGCRTFEAGRARAIVGRLRIEHAITGETADFSAGALHLGDHNLVAGVRDWPGESEHQAVAEEIEEAFSRAALPEVLRILDRYFEGSTYSLDSLFLDERRRVLDKILESTMEDVAGVYRRLYRQHASLILFLRELDAPLPGPLLSTAEFVLNEDLKAAFRSESPDPEQILKLLQQAEADKINLDTRNLQPAAQSWLDRAARSFGDRPGSMAGMEAFTRTVERTLELPFDVNLKGARDLYWGLLKQVRTDGWSPPGADGAAWAERFDELGSILGFRIDRPAG